ncbi:myb family transcription factor [Galdieria sulphuraria]|uniref:Myb family transcription factor n=1 Tax=Galdieria sulphuraria TaxID=130081 RepID=M2XVX0_GALSU|nr:myb family transcription factor [Galdieria sulphuraria]EME27793.1 myb family transcription factor [Galdieria sulphuraria]|eukprot:XP_005704313.1 myb family transcription factor [Galdieria sulphuraria]
MDNHANDNWKESNHPSSLSSSGISNDSYPDKQTTTSKKIIYNRSRIVHMDEMIRAILPKLDIVDQENVKRCYEAWKGKQVKTHTLLHQLRDIVSSDLLHNEVERIRQEKWKRSRYSTTGTIRRCSSRTSNHDSPKESQAIICNSTSDINKAIVKDKNHHSEENPYLLSNQPSVKRSWTKKEHFLFLQGLEEYGKGQWQSIANKIGTKTASQVRSHCKKYLMRQQKDQQSKKMKTIHDMTMESPEMQQIAKKQLSKSDEKISQEWDKENPFFYPLSCTKESIDKEKRDQVAYDNDSNGYEKQQQKEENNHRQGQITKIPYFIRERRIRRLEYRLQQMNHSMNWMLCQVTPSFSVNHHIS